MFIFCCNKQHKSTEQCLNTQGNQTVAADSSHPFLTTEEDVFKLQPQFELMNMDICTFVNK